MDDTTGANFRKVKYVVVEVSTEKTRKQDKMLELNERLKLLADY